MRDSRQVATVAVFTAMIVGSDFALTPLPNVKLMDTLVFLAAYFFGFRVGASVGILSESVWAFASPNGSAGFLAPFLVAGEALFAAAGAAAARVWGIEGDPRSRGLYVGSLLALCAFAWDMETTVASSLLWFWPAVTPGKVLGTVVIGLPFTLTHEVSDFLLGATAAPIVVLMAPRLSALKGRLGLVPARAEERN